MQAYRKKVIEKNAKDAKEILEKMTDKPHNQLSEAEVEQIITGATDLQKKAYSALLLARACEDAVADDRSKNDHYMVYDDSAISYSRHRSASLGNQVNGADIASITDGAANISA